ncbi:MAG: hypothetical protein ACPGJS_11950 [Flammeovirgaceae bacterium]
MNMISDLVPESGRPPILNGHTITALETIVKEKSLKERESDYAYTWTLYLTDGGQCSYQDVITAFLDIHEYIVNEPVLDNTLIGQSGIGFLMEPGSEWDGNPRDGFRRGIDIVSGGFDGIHFSCWIGEEWQHDPQISPRFELPIHIKTNWDWESEKLLWQFIAQRFAKIGYTDSTLNSSLKRHLLKRLENHPEELKALT